MSKGHEEKNLDLEWHHRKMDTEMERKDLLTGSDDCITLIISADAYAFRYLRCISNSILTYIIAHPQQFIRNWAHLQNNPDDHFFP